MELMKTHPVRFALLVGVVFSVASAFAAEGPYHFLKEIVVGGDGGWDYLSVDSAGRRLYASHSTKVVVIDLDSNKVVGEIDDTPGVHGLAVAPDLGLGFVSDGRENKASIVDLKTLKTLAKVDTGPNPDGLVYDPRQQAAWFFNGRGQSATVINAKTRQVVATVPLGGKPEFPTVDPEAGRVFDNLEDKSEVAAIDTKTHEVVNRWPTAPGEEPSGMAIDTKHHRLFLGCANELMVMMDYTDGKVVATVPIGRRVDANAFDAGTQLAFASCGDGTTTIAHEDSADKLTLVQRLQTAPGARTMTLDPKTHNIYLAAAQFETMPSPVPGGRPRMIRGTFRILVYGMEPAAK